MDDLVSASKAVTVHVAALVEAIRHREQILVIMAQHHPNLEPADIIAACSAASRRGRNEISD